MKLVINITEHAVWDLQHHWSPMLLYSTNSSLVIAVPPQSTIMKISKST